MVEARKDLGLGECREKVGGGGGVEVAWKVFSGKGEGC